MPVSEARMNANRLNSRKSTGPKTEAGKSRSRENSYKHGLTGEGVVLSTEDARALDARFSALLDDQKPEGEAARLLVHRAALMSVRMDRSARQEAGSISCRVEGAVSTFDDARKAEAEQLMYDLEANPATNARRLMASPEGVDLLIAEWEKLKADLEHPLGARWSYTHQVQANFLRGSRGNFIGPNPYLEWTSVMHCDSAHPTTEEIAGLSVMAKRDLAVLKLGELVDGDLARLREHRATMDTRIIDARRAHAADIALFDPSKEAVLARKYDAANERVFLRILGELKEMRRAAKAEPAKRSGRSLASFFPGPPAEPPTPPRDASGPILAPILPTNELAISIGRSDERRE